MRIYIALILLSLSSPAGAVVPIITGFTGVSAQSIVGTTYTAYGGFAGTCSVSDGVSPCNSCDAASLTACTTTPLCKCNTANVYDSVTVTVIMQPQAAPLLGGHGCAAAASASAAGAKVHLTNVNLANDATTVDFKWSELCQTTAAGATCATVAATNTINVDVWIALGTNSCGTAPTTGDSEIAPVVIKILNPGVAGTYDVYGAPAEGISSFHPYPGDGKIYVEDIVSSSLFPTFTYGGTARNVVVFASPNSIDDANYSAPPLTPAILPIVDNGNTLEKNIVDNLENDKRYFFRLAIMDEANNVVQYFPDLTANGSPDCLSAGTPDPTKCPYSAIPSQVLGLLTKDFNCFIATAAYGTPLEPKIQTFRLFRNKFLLTNPWGLEFVKSYYHYGTLGARYITDKPVLRAMVRGILWPLYSFSYLALKIGFAYAFAIFVMLITASIGIPWYGLRKLHPRE